jgi:hypothetical protein
MHADKHVVECSVRSGTIARTKANDPSITLRRILMPRLTSTPDLNDGAAAYVLDRLIREKRVAVSEVTRYVAELPAEISRLEERIRLLRAAAQTEVENRKARRRPQRAARRTSAVRQPQGSRSTGKALGGMFGGLIRRVPIAEQRQYQELKNTQGIEAAIAALRRRKAG